MNEYYPRGWLDTSLLLGSVRDLLADGGRATSRNILLSGPWGCGKSTLLAELQSCPEIVDGYRVHMFTPSRLTADIDPRLAFLREIAELARALVKDGPEGETRLFADGILGTLKKALPVLPKSLSVAANAAQKILPNSPEVIAAGAFFAILNDLMTNQGDPTADKAQERLSSLRKLMRKQLSTIQKLSEKPLLLLVDDLDRTRPEQAVAFLDCMYHLFLPHEDDPDDADWPLTSVWAVNTTVLEEYLYREYREIPSFDPAAYVEKLFHHRVSVPPVFGPSHGEWETKEPIPNNDARTLWQRDFNDDLASVLAKGVNYASLGNLRLHARLRRTLKRIPDSLKAHLNIDLVRLGRLVFLVTAFPGFRDHIALYQGMWPQFLNRLNRRHAQGDLDMVVHPVYRHIDDPDLATVLLDLEALDYDRSAKFYVRAPNGMERLRRELSELARRGI